jgi:hypothetical protein
VSGKLRRRSMGYGLKEEQGKLPVAAAEDREHGVGNSSGIVSG